MTYESARRAWEMQLRAECPEYAASRLVEARQWKQARHLYGPAMVRKYWINMYRARKVTVQMITDNMFYQSDPSPLSKSWEKFWDADGN